MTGIPSDGTRNRAVYKAVQEFAAAAQDIASLADLSNAVEDVTRWLGFDRFAIINHVDFGRVVPGIRLTNYPVEFIGRLRELGLTRDPVLRASERARIGFA